MTELDKENFIEKIHSNKFNYKPCNYYCVNCNSKIFLSKDKNYTLDEKDETICYCRQCIDSYNQYYVSNS